VTGPKRATRRSVRSELDDLRDDADADDTDVTVTITSVDVPPANDGDDGDGPPADDAVVTHARTSTDPDVPDFRVDPDDVRGRLADNPPADTDAQAGYYADGHDPCGAETVDGTPCRRPSLTGVDRCEVHLPEDGFADG